jgi:hypothetical protein
MDQRSLVPLEVGQQLADVVFQTSRSAELDALDVPSLILCLHRVSSTASTMLNARLQKIPRSKSQPRVRSNSRPKVDACR